MARGPVRSTKTRRSGIRWLLAVLVLAIAAMGALSQLLPGVILDRYQRLSADMGGGYRGDATDVALTFLPPGYELRDVRVRRHAARDTRPLVLADTVQVRLHPWRRRSDVVVRGLRLSLVGGQGRAVQFGAGVRWRHFLDALAPATSVDSVRFEGATLDFALPPDDTPLVSLDRMRGSLQHLSAVPTTQQPAPAKLELQARVLGRAPLELEARFDPQQRMQRLNLRMQVRGLALASLNPLLRRWEQVDFAGGSTDAQVQLRSDARRVRGQLDTTMRDVDVFDWKQDVGRDRGGLLAAAKELLAGSGAALQRNRHGQWQRAFEIDAPLELPEDNLDGLRAVFEAALIDMQRELRQ